MKTKFMRPPVPWMKKKGTTGGMGFIASKHFNHDKNSEQLGTKSKKLSTRKSQVLTNLKTNMI